MDSNTKNSKKVECASDSKPPFSKGAQASFDERMKQIQKYGYTGENAYEHPEYYSSGQLKDASIKLLSVTENNTPEMIREPLNWNKDWFYKLLNEPYEERVKIASALLMAELDYLEVVKSKTM